MMREKERVLTDVCDFRRQTCKKSLQCKDLTIEMQHMLNVKTKMIPAIIGAAGTISQSFRKYLSNILGKRVGYCRVEYDEQLQHSNSNNIYYASFPCTVSYNWSRYSIVCELSNDVFSVPCEQRMPTQPSHGNVLTGGGDLREAQVDVPLSVSHTCV
jgi:hypothetical protein